MNGSRGAFVDTNVLVRYFTDDPPELAQVAEEIIEKEVELLVSSVILLECGYVLQKLYGHPRSGVVDVLVDFLQRENVAMADMPKELAASALLSLKEGEASSFGDTLIVASMRASGVDRIYSFDRRLRAEGITVIRKSPL